jgi:hypothetical protein
MQNENSTNTLYKCPFLSSDFDTENIVELKQNIKVINNKLEFQINWGQLKLTKY